MSDDQTNPPPRPTWVKVALIAAALIAAAVVIAAIAGGGHGPGRHLPGGDGAHTAPIERAPS